MVESNEVFATKASTGSEHPAALAHCSSPGERHGEWISLSGTDLSQILSQQMKIQINPIPDFILLDLMLISRFTPVCSASLSINLR